MARTLAIASIVWPMLLGVALWQRASGHEGVFSLLIYGAASRVCHQRPERSFHTAGVSWPVCGRCSGLYLAAPFGAALALMRMRRRAMSRGYVRMLVIASVPTFVTLGLELAGVWAPSNLTRAIAALPAGATLAFVLVRLAAGDPQSIK